MKKTTLLNFEDAKVAKFYIPAIIILKLLQKKSVCPQKMPAVTLFFATVLILHLSLCIPNIRNRKYPLNNYPNHRL
jgi:hypothetical protein